MNLKINQILVSVIAMFCLGTMALFSQGIKPPSPGKALVFFVRGDATNALPGGLRIMDGDQPIGKLKGRGNLRYECSPGEHFFFTSEYLHAELEAGKIYVVDVSYMVHGAGTTASSAILLTPVNSLDYDKKRWERIKKALKKPSPSYSSKELEKMKPKMKLLQFNEKRARKLLAKGKLEHLGSFSFTPSQLL